MGRKKRCKVFVSYSRHDEALVKPLAGLLGVAADDAVFYDVEQLKPGDRWEMKILGAVHDSSVFVICWCCNCEKSRFVAKEISTALSDAKKKIVPVLFCFTSLPANLSRHQWIDLRGKIVHPCEHVTAVSAAGDGNEVAAEPQPTTKIGIGFEGLINNSSAKVKLNPARPSPDDGKLKRWPSPDEVKPYMPRPTRG